MKPLLSYIGREKKRFFLTSLLITLCSVLRVLHALINTYTFNNLIALNMTGFFKFLLIDVVVFAVLSLTLGMTQYVRAAAVQRFSLDLRQDIAAQIEATPVEHFSAKNTGTYASWLTNDITLIEQNGFDNLFDLVQIITDPLFSLIALWHFHWSFLPVVFALSFFTVLLPQFVHKQLAKANLFTTKSNENLLSVINDALHGFSIFSIFGVEKQLSLRITAATNKLIARKLHQVCYEAVANNVAGLSNIIGQLLVEGWTGFLAIQKIIPIGAIASSANLSYNVFNSIAVFAPVLTQMRALTPVFEKYHLHDESGQAQLGAMTIPERPKLTLKVNELTFKYPHQQRAVFQPFSLTLRPGDKVALTGESGTGKSTILKILAGQLRQYQGSIQVNGVELRDSCLASLHQQVLYVDQTPYLFNDTIRYNLELGESFSDDELQAALVGADLAQDVAKMAAGLATEVGEGGQSLSGGQRQRLALARGLLRRQQLFLFDESTSNLSQASALRVEDNILKQQDLSVIFVSHQLHEENIAEFDQVITLK
ncbi:ABC transporter ATP-binding protein [Lapidilactobacillus luobeiensis]|uniref:ABC transporter ATP-binding protein n=1 Tax=Lapidilactobacillus luobeiensis TaxID=2950371 RepID=UPI0021C449D8|nr:ABC transporter ATP-binding protein [Lapidilactobacillus luobeiensis]